MAGLHSRGGRGGQEGSPLDLRQGPSLPHPLTQSHPHSLSSHSDFPHTHTLPHPLSVAPSLSRTLPHSHPLSPTSSLTHTLTHSHPLSLTPRPNLPAFLLTHSPPQAPRGPAPPKALRGGISKSILHRPCQFLAINAHEMAPRTKRWLQERRRDTPT